MNFLSSYIYKITFLLVGLLLILMPDKKMFGQDVRGLLPLTGPVIDTVGVLSPSIAKRISQKILDLQKEKGSQIQVLVISSTQPESIEEYSIRVAEAWKIGRKGVDDGVLLVVAKDDRKLRIEVGYGLEGAIPDVTAKRIIDQIITPEFKAGNFDKGIEDGVDALIGLIKGESLPALEKRWNEGWVSEKDGESFLGFAYMIAIGAGLFFRIFKLTTLVFFSMFIIIAVSSIIIGTEIIEPP